MIVLDAENVVSFRFFRIEWVPVIELVFVEVVLDSNGPRVSPLDKYAKMRSIPRGVRGGDPLPFFIKDDLVLIPDHLRDCAVFIGTMEGPRFTPRATGFLAGYVEFGFQFLHIVTAEHVVSGLLTTNQRMFCRVNLISGGTKEIEIPPDAWKFYPDERESTDVAVCKLPGQGVAPNETGVWAEHRVVGLNGEYSIAATDDIMTEKNIGLGEEVCIVVLFRSHYGNQQNIPIVRTGNIAMLKGEPIKTKFKGFMEAYLIEARSIGGLSGSPVFVSLPAYRIIDGRIEITSGSHIYLLGLMHGHFDVPDLNADIVIDDPHEASNGIHSGIGVVIPVQKIIDTMRHPDLTAARREEAMKLNKEGGATPDLAAPDRKSEPEANSDANPDHREAFNRLVSAASKPKPKGDRT